jgi:hypothetical protein
MFTILEEAGVDLSDPSSINHFIMSLRERNPELAQRFEEAVNQLLGGEEPVEGEIPQTIPGAPNEMTNEAVPEDIRGPLPEGPPGSQLG